MILMRITCISKSFQKKIFRSCDHRLSSVARRIIHQVDIEAFTWNHRQAWMPVVTNFLGGSLRLPLQVSRQTAIIIKHHQTIVNWHSAQSTHGGTSKAQQSSRSSIIGWVLSKLWPSKLQWKLFPKSPPQSWIWWISLWCDLRWTCGLAPRVENLSAESLSLNSTLPPGIQTWPILVNYQHHHLHHNFWHCSHIFILFILQGTSQCV